MADPAAAFGAASPSAADVLALRRLEQQQTLTTLPARASAAPPDAGAGLLPAAFPGPLSEDPMDTTPPAAMAAAVPLTSTLTSSSLAATTTHPHPTSTADPYGSAAGPAKQSHHGAGNEPHATAQGIDNASYTRQSPSRPSPLRARDQAAGQVAACSAAAPGAERAPSETAATAHFPPTNHPATAPPHELGNQQRLQQQQAQGQTGVSAPPDSSLTVTGLAFNAPAAEPPHSETLPITAVSADLDALDLAGGPTLPPLFTPSGAAARHLACLMRQGASQLTAGSHQPPFLDTPFFSLGSLTGFAGLMSPAHLQTASGGAHLPLTSPPALTAAQQSVGGSAQRRLAFPTISRLPSFHMATPGTFGPDIKSSASTNDLRGLGVDDALLSGGGQLPANSLYFRQRALQGLGQVQAQGQADEHGSQEHGSQGQGRGLQQPRHPAQHLQQLQQLHPPPCMAGHPTQAATAAAAAGGPSVQHGHGPAKAAVHAPSVGAGSAPASARGPVPPHAPGPTPGTVQQSVSQLSMPDPLQLLLSQGGSQADTSSASVGLKAQALASCVVAALQSRASSSGSPVVLPPSYADILTTGLLAGQALGFRGHEGEVDASCRLRVGSFVLKPDQVDDAGAVELLLINLDSVSLKTFRELMRPGAATSIPALSGSWLHSTSPNQLSTAAAQAPKPTNRLQGGAASAAHAVAGAREWEGTRLGATGATGATGVAGGGAAVAPRQQPAAGPGGAALRGAAGRSQQAAEILQQQQHLMQQPAPPSSGLSLFKSLYQADVPPLWQPSPSTSSRAPGGGLWERLQRLDSDMLQDTPASQTAQTAPHAAAGGHGHTPNPSTAAAAGCMAGTAEAAGQLGSGRTRAGQLKQEAGAAAVAACTWVCPLPLHMHGAKAAPSSYSDPECVAGCRPRSFDASGSLLYLPVAQHHTTPARGRGLGPGGFGVTGSASAGAAGGGRSGGTAAPWSGGPVRSGSRLHMASDDSDEASAHDAAATLTALAASRVERPAASTGGRRGSGGGGGGGGGSGVAARRKRPGVYGQEVLESYRPAKRSSTAEEGDMSPSSIDAGEVMGGVRGAGSGGVGGQGTVSAGEGGLRRARHLPSRFSQQQVLGSCVTPPAGTTTATTVATAEVTSPRRMDMEVEGVGGVEGVTSVGDLMAAGDRVLAGFDGHQVRVVAGGGAGPGGAGADDCGVAGAGGQPAEGGAPAGVVNAVNRRKRALGRPGMGRAPGAGEAAQEAVEAVGRDSDVPAGAMSDPAGMRVPGQVQEGLVGARARGRPGQGGVLGAVAGPGSRGRGSRRSQVAVGNQGHSQGQGRAVLGAGQGFAARGPRAASVAAAAALRSAMELGSGDEGLEEGEGAGEEVAGEEEDDAEWEMQAAWAKQHRARQGHGGGRGRGRSRVRERVAAGEGVVPGPVAATEGPAAAASAAPAPTNVLPSDSEGPGGAARAAAAATAAAAAAGEGSSQLTESVEATQASGAGAGAGGSARSAQPGKKPSRILAAVSGASRTACRARALPGESVGGVPVYRGYHPQWANSCASCGTQTAPTWRKGWPLVGPGAAPGTLANLCNACGIKYKDGSLAPPPGASGARAGGGGRGAAGVAAAAAQVTAPPRSAAAAAGPGATSTQEGQGGAAAESAALGPLAAPASAATSSALPRKQHRQQRLEGIPTKKVGRKPRKAISSTATAAAAEVLQQVQLSHALHAGPGAASGATGPAAGGAAAAPAAGGAGEERGADIECGREKEPGEPGWDVDLVRQLSGAPKLRAAAATANLQIAAAFARKPSSPTAVRRKVPGSSPRGPRATSIKRERGDMEVLGGEAEERLGEGEGGGGMVQVVCREVSQAERQVQGLTSEGEAEAGQQAGESDLQAIESNGGDGQGRIAGQGSTAAAPPPASSAAAAGGTSNVRASARDTGVHGAHSYRAQTEAPHEALPPAASAAPDALAPMDAADAAGMETEAAALAPENSATPPMPPGTLLAASRSGPAGAAQGLAAPLGSRAAMECAGQAPNAGDGCTVDVAMHGGDAAAQALHRVTQDVADPAAGGGALTIGEVDGASAGAGGSSGSVGGLPTPFANTQAAAAVVKEAAAPLPHLGVPPNGDSSGGSSLGDAEAAVAAVLPASLEG